MVECIASSPELLNWANLPLVSIVHGIFLVGFIEVGIFSRIVSVDKNLKENPLKLLKTMCISAMGRPACPHLSSVSIEEGGKKEKKKKT